MPRSNQIPAILSTAIHEQNEIGWNNFFAGYVTKSWGLAAQAGVDIAINDDWFVNMDVKYIQMDTTAKFSNTAVGSAQISADIDPFVYAIGVGRRF